MNPYKETLRKFFSEYVRTLRKCRGLTQEEMAEKLRISGRAYSDLERGIYCFSTVALVFLLLMLEEGEISHKMSYNRVIESEKNPVVVKLSNGMPVYVFALAHCGVMGTLNRNRGSGDKLLLNRQKNDWARVLPVFWSDPLLLNTYWEPSIKMLREIEASEEKRSWCKAYSVYAPQTDKQGLIRTFRQFMNDTYKNGVVIGNYREMMNRLNLDDQQVVKAESAWVDTLSLYGAVACLAYHFRRDHFCEGSLINDSVANGCVLRLMERIYKLLVAMP